MSPRDDLNRLHDILDAIGRIELYAADGLPSTREDPVWDAILYNLAIIGEAVKDVSPDTLDAAPEVDWSNASKMRDVLIHRYFATDLSVVAATVDTSIPQMKSAVERMIGTVGEE